MKRFACQCGQSIYFDNHQCNVCRRQLAFDPVRLDMLAIAADERGDGVAEFCTNRTSVIRCNWVARDDVADGLCLSCQTSKVIPALNKPANRERWRRLEVAKRRLIYGLLSEGLPVDPARLRFAFKEDRRTNPDVYEEHVSTGHASGVITINAAEADDVFREQMRRQMHEPYRTLLGHLRHESGHYYFDIIVDSQRLARARELFGDERVDYAAALQHHYVNGPVNDWWVNYISAYASSHPMEDWAETWAHYLHIRAVLQTARAHSMIPPVDETDWETTFVDFVLTINEISRSLGLADAYPFTLSRKSIEKLEFMHETVRAYVDKHRPPVVPVSLH
jgi:hypothetical protein